MNAPDDAWATKLDETARAVNPNREPMVVRVHGEKSEREYFGKDTRDHRNKNFPSTKPPVVSGDYSESEFEADLEQLFAAKILWDAYQESVKKPHGVAKKQRCQRKARGSEAQRRPAVASQPLQQDLRR